MKLHPLVKAMLYAARSSEFWTFVGITVTQSLSVPVPEEAKNAGFAGFYIALRVASKVIKYVFPNPANQAGGWFKAD